MKIEKNKILEKTKDTKIILLIVIVGLILLASLLMIIGMEANFDAGLGIKTSVSDQLQLLNLNLFDYAQYSRDASEFVKQPQMNLVNTALAGFSFFIIVIPVIIAELVIVLMPILKEKAPKSK